MQTSFANTACFRASTAYTASRTTGNTWYASGDKLNALDPERGTTVRSLDVAAHAGTAFDGRHLYQIVEDRIEKIDPESGRVLATIPAPGKGGDSGLAWRKARWVGQYRERKIHQVDPQRAPCCARSNRTASSPA